MPLMPRLPDISMFDFHGDRYIITSIFMPLFKMLRFATPDMLLQAARCGSERKSRGL